MSVSGLPILWLKLTISFNQFQKPLMIPLSSSIVKFLMISPLSFTISCQWVETVEKLPNFQLRSATPKSVKDLAPSPWVTSCPFDCLSWPGEDESAPTTLRLSFDMFNSICCSFLIKEKVALLRLYVVVTREPPWLVDGSFVLMTAVVIQMFSTYHHPKAFFPLPLSCKKGTWVSQ